MSSSLFHTLFISRQDMITRLADLDVISNNLANMNTAGFKASRSNFQELLQSKVREGIYVPSTQALTVQGALRASDNTLDWSIEGEGFFQVKLPNGSTGYTRDGEFTLDENRDLVNASGYKLIWQGQVPADATKVSIDTEGGVDALMVDGTTQHIGQVQLARFNNPTALGGYGNNAWLETAASGPATVGNPGSNNLGKTHANSVEQSNVNIAREMTSLSIDQRAFELSMRTFQQTDLMIQQAIALRKA